MIITSPDFTETVLDNNGYQLRGYVHVDLVALQYNGNNINAFWDGNIMIYGDGGTSGSTTVTPLTALDVVGHEITHGLTSQTAGLGNTGETGALNEGFSDIFGTAIENYAKGYGSNWTIGENIGLTLRSMSNPNIYGHPDTYGGTYWTSTAGCVPTNQNDACGVHINNGVLNYWFYLLSLGGSGTNDIGNAFKVGAITMDKAAAIAYRTLTTKLTPTSNFDDARTQSIIAAQELYCAGSLEERAVTNAWYAVGVGAAHPTESINGDFPSGSCASTIQSFAVENPVSGLTYGWSVTSGLQIIGSTTGNLTSIKVIGNGDQYVTLRVVTNCGTQNIISKKVAVGIRAPIVNTSDDRTPQPSNYSYHTATAQLLPGTTSSNYVWYQEATGSSTTLTYINSGVSLYRWPIPPCTSKFYQLQITTACGTAVYRGYAYNTYCGGGFAFSAYPNPADNQLTVERNVLEEEPYSPMTDQEALDYISARQNKLATFDAELYDKFSHLIQKGKSTDGKLDFNLKELPKGLYFLRVTDGKNMITKQIVIEKGL